MKKKNKNDRIQKNLIKKKGKTPIDYISQVGRSSHMISRKEIIEALKKNRVKHNLDKFLSSPLHKGVWVKSGNKDLRMNVPSNPLFFDYAVAEPMMVKNIKPSKEWFNEILIECFKLKFRSKWRYTKKNDIKKILEEMNKLSELLYEHNLAEVLSDFDDQLIEAEHNLIEFYRQKQKNKFIKPSKITKEIPIITRALIRYWQISVKDNTKINAYSKGNSIDKEYYKKDNTAKLLISEIDVNYNPGGAFIQRVLRCYFGMKMNNLQLKRLIAEAYKIEFKNMSQKLSIK